MSEKDVEKEIEEIKARLKKVEEHVGLCREHEESKESTHEHESHH